MRVLSKSMMTSRRATMICLSTKLPKKMQLVAVTPKKALQFQRLNKRLTIGFCKKDVTFQQQNITVLPGQYLARQSSTGNPGENYIRMALVAPLAQCIEAAQRIKQCVSEL